MRTTRLAAGLLLIGIGACADRQDTIAGIPEGAADGLYPRIVVYGSRSTTVEVTVALLAQPAGVRLGSYQGELRYDPQTLRIVQAALPAGVDGALNADVPGVVRFAATSLDGFGQESVLALRFSRLRDIRSETFAVSFEEVSAASEFSDLTSTVSARPILVLD